MAIIRTAGEGASNAVKGYKDNIPDIDPNQNYSVTVSFAGIDDASATNYYFVVTGVDADGFESEPSNITGTFAPEVINVAPAVGSKMGGSEIILTGNNLFYGATVTFGTVTVDPAVNPEKIQYESITQIKCILPQHPDWNDSSLFPLSVDVIVKKFAGSLSESKLDNGFKYLNFGIYAVRVKDFNSKYRYPEISGSILHLTLNDLEAKFSVLGAKNPQQAYTWKFYKNGGGTVTFNTTNTNSFTWNISASPVPAYYKLEVYDTSYPQYSHVVNFDVHVPSAIDPDTKPTTAAGGSVSTIKILGGDADSNYDWKLTYPDASVLTGVGKNFDFTAPDLPGCFAGTYFFEVNGNFGTFSDSFAVKVPLRIEVDGGPQYIIYDTENLLFFVEGSCSVSSTAASLYESDKNGVRLYPNSAVANTGGPPPDEEFFFSPDIDFPQDVYTRLSFTAAGADTANYDFRVVPLVDVTGRVVDDAGNGIVGATVSVLAPDLPAPPLPADVKEQWQTIADGYFPTVKLPYTQEIYSFLISAPNKIAKTVYSADFQLGEIELSPTIESYTISGNIPALTAAGESAIIEVYYKKAGVFNFAGRTTATYEADPDYMYSFEQTIVDYIKNSLVEEIVIHAVRKRDNPDRDLFGLTTDDLSGSWPIENKNINLNVTKVPGTDTIEVAEGGVFEYIHDNISAVIVKIPPGAVADLAGAEIRINVSEHPVIDPPNYTVSKSGATAYEITAEYLTLPDSTPIDSFNSKILITIPFDLNAYYTGAFTSTRAFIIRHANDYYQLESDQGAAPISKADIEGPNPDDFWVDPIGDRTLGKVTFRTGSLSVFGVGTPPPPVPSSTPPSGGDDGGGGCFIATAAYGSPLDRHISILKQFRDHILLPTRWGQSFVRAYYRWSPPVADFIRDHGMIRTAARWSLMPLVGFSWMAVKVGIGPTLLMMLMIGIGGGMILRKRLKASAWRQG